jgi:hypothetical protein
MPDARCSRSPGDCSSNFFFKSTFSFHHKPPASSCLDKVIAAGMDRSAV